MSGSEPLQAERGAGLQEDPWQRGLDRDEPQAAAGHAREELAAACARPNAEKDVYSLAYSLPEKQQAGLSQVSTPGRWCLSLISHPRQAAFFSKAKR